MPKLIIDAREEQHLVDALNKRCNALRTHKTNPVDIVIERQMLDVGDFLYVVEEPGKSLIIERKTWKDFIDSVIGQNARLWDQLHNMALNRDNFRPVLLISGNRYQALVEHQDAERLDKAVRGMVSAVLYDYQIPTFNCLDDEELLDVVLSLVRQVTSPPSERPVEFKKKKVTVQDVQENMLSANRGVGIKTAKALLAHFGTVQSVVNASLPQLKEVVGDSVSQKIYNTVRGIEEKNGKQKHK
ncbi:MAG: hypothetical protein HY376_02100 [Candidatus Blackburnbacteria bacterium]|nr:hypothetical protein [Candidatus Blackburnbacteria bacterium]